MNKLPVLCLLFTIMLSGCNMFLKDCDVTIKTTETVWDSIKNASFNGSPLPSEGERRFTVKEGDYVVKWTTYGTFLGTYLEEDYVETVSIITDSKYEVIGNDVREVW